MKVKSRRPFYCFLLIVISLLFPVLAYIFHTHWAIEIFSHLRLYSIATCALCFLALYFFVDKSKKYLFLCFVFLLIFLSQIVAVSPLQESTGAETLKVISFNVHSANKQYDLLIEYIKSQVRKEEATIVLLMEVNDEWVAQLEPLKKILQTFHFVPREDNFGIAFFSNRPVTDKETLIFDRESLPTVTAKLTFTGNKTITFIGSHPLPPINSHFFFTRNWHLDQLARHVKVDPYSKVVAGDFNISPWSRYFDEFMDHAQLKRARSLFEQMTWQSGPLALPIDHIFYSGSLSLIDYKVGPHLGSDHRPVTAVFEVH